MTVLIKESECSIVLDCIPVQNSNKFHIKTISLNSELPIAYREEDVFISGGKGVNFFDIGIIEEGDSLGWQNINVPYKYNYSICIIKSIKRQTKTDTDLGFTRVADSLEWGVRGLSVNIETMYDIYNPLTKRFIKDVNLVNRVIDTKDENNVNKEYVPYDRQIKRGDILLLKKQPTPYWENPHPYQVIRNITEEKILWEKSQHII